jgi:endonuclease/exonuclease/phosphatase (EEP) superfamily protein YafD
MKQAITLIEQRPDHERVIFFGDFNSVPMNASVARSPAMLGTGIYARSCGDLDHAAYL